MGLPGGLHAAAHLPGAARTANHPGEAYIRAVAADTGIGPDEALDTLDPATMVPVAAAISRVENGTVADPDEIRRGWELFTG